MKTIQALKRVVEALEKDTVEYDWNKPNMCNCGLIAQAALSLNPKDLDTRFRADAAAYKRDTDSKGSCLTWKAVVQRSCGVTGLSSSEIITAFGQAGFRPEDVVHLEFLENKAILKEAGIDGTQGGYYKKKENLMKYLRAWIKILETEKIPVHTKTDRKVDIERSLLIAAGNRDEAKSQELKDLLVVALN